MSARSLTGSTMLLLLLGLLWLRASTVWIFHLF